MPKLPQGPLNPPQPEPIKRAPSESAPIKPESPVSKRPPENGDLWTGSTPQSKDSTPQVQLFSEPKTASKDGWKVKSAHLNFGYVLDNDVLHTGPMHIQHEGHGTDATISGFSQTDRKNWEYLTIQKGQRFAPDEPQFNVGVGLQFENHFGVELDAKHNKIIMDGYEQDVQVQGMWNGQEVDQTVPLNHFMKQHEQTLGNMQISALGTYTFDLPAPAKHRLSWVTKAGPSLITSNTRTQMLAPSGEFEGGTNKLQAVGYGAILENGVRYQFGPKVGQLGLELSHSLSYMNYANYQSVDGYKMDHSALYSGFALKATVGLYGNKK